MSLNGAKTSDRTFLDPGFTSYDKTVLYTTDDVTSLIRQDASAARENVLASQLGSGQYDNETTSGDWGWSTAEWRANPTLKADLVVKYADGTEQVVNSDDDLEGQRRRPDPLRQPLPRRDLRRAPRARRLERARLRRRRLGRRPAASPARPACCARRTSSAPR